MFGIRRNEFGFINLSENDGEWLYFTGHRLTETLAMSDLGLFIKLGIK
jgi:hypothetical protein